MQVHRYTEHYKGTEITIETSRNADGTWTAAASLPSAISVAAVRSPNCPTEDEARRQALTAAVEAIDRSRTRIGKP